jgi:tRNA-binding protein
VLLNSQVIAVTNLPPETNSPDQIGVSECLVLGVVVDNKEVVLLKPEREVANGTGIA